MGTGLHPVVVRFGLLSIRVGIARIGPPTSMSVRVNAMGALELPANRPANLDCYGKTIDQLRAMGRVSEFQRTVSGR